MRERDDGRALALVAAPDAGRQPADPEEALDCEPADRNDQGRPDDPQLPVAPERAELLLPRGRRAVTAPRRRAPGIAARHGGAVVRRVERVLVQLAPAPPGLSRAATPGATLLAFDDAGGLSIHVRPLVETLVAHGPRFEWIARLDAGAADAQVALERGERAVGASPAPVRRRACARWRRDRRRRRADASSGSRCRKRCRASAAAAALR